MLQGCSGLEKCTASEKLSLRSLAGGFRWSETMTRTI